ncbi:MAG: class I SAM-dependent methyltransferase [Prochloraceae cyanobacterium]
MNNQGSYQVKVYHSSLEKEFDRLKRQCELTWEKEARNLSWFGVEDGMSVLELGSGTGVITEKLLNLLPHSQITALDHSQVMLDRAKKYLQNKNQDRVNFVEASISKSDLPDNSFDLAFARLVFQHLSDPITAAKEVRRVLKPGGKLIITDIDNQFFCLSSPPVSEAQFILDKLADYQSAKGGNRFISRQLWSILKMAGFKNIDLETIICHSGNWGVEELLLQFDSWALFLHKQGLINVSELKITDTAKKKIYETTNPFIGLVWFMVYGEK